MSYSKVGISSPNCVTILPNYGFVHIIYFKEIGEIVRKIFFLIALSCTSFIFAQIENLYVIKVQNKAGFERLHNTALAHIDEYTGISWDSADNINNVATSEEMLEKNGFRIGEYIVLCFTPKQSLYIRLLDTKPNGQVAQIYPANNGTVLFDGGKTHCIGDRGPYFYADEASGIGEGILWFHGSTHDSSGQSLAEWQVPSTGSFAWEATPTISISEATNPNNSREKIYKAQYRYKIYP